jgi:hypothetical protein
MEHTFSWLSQSHRMSKDNDGLCATAEAFVLDRYSHWMPSMGRNTADGMDEALG